MKKVSFLAAALSIMLLGACSQDEWMDNGATDGTAALRFTASVESPNQTRATVDNTWDGGEEVQIKVGTLDARTYVISSTDQSTLTAKTGVTAFMESDGTAATAWYSPQVATTAFDLSDQSTADKYKSFDVMKASATAVGGAADLKFDHQMAQVTITLQNAQGGTLVFTDATVTVQGYTTASQSEGNITAPSDATVGEIKMCKAAENTYKALLPACSTYTESETFATVTIGTKKYNYKPTTAPALEGGKSYSYTLTVQ